MNGLMKNFNLEETAKKDKIAHDFIMSVNPYRSKPSLGIDLRKLSKYVKDNNLKVISETDKSLFLI